MKAINPRVVKARVTKSPKDLKVSKVSKDPKAPRAAKQRAVRTATDEGALESVVLLARLLDALALAGEAQGVTQLARLTGEGKTRVYRYLSSLRSQGLVDQDVATGRYRLGWKLFQLGEAAAAQFDLKRLADPLLRRLRDLTQLSALLAVPFNGEALVVASIEDERKVSVTVRPGNRPSAHGSAQGRIALAWSDASLQQRILAGRLEALSPNTLVDPAQVRRRLQRLRQRLWEDAPNESLIGINAIAAPVFRNGEELAGMLTLVGTLQDIPSPPPARLIDLIRGAASLLSDTLGGTPYRTLGLVPPKALLAV